MRKWWKEALRRKARPSANRNHLVRRVLGFESLEDRRLLTTTLTAIQPSFVQEGPAPIVNPNATISNQEVKSDIGAVQAVAVDTLVDSSGNTVYAGTVNGGIWETTNYYSTSSGPTWTAITDQDNINIPNVAGASGALTANLANTTPSSGLNGSLSISALAIDKSTILPGSLAAGSVLVAATGHYSDVGLNSTGAAGGPLTGVWESLPNGGNALADGNPDTWYQVEGIPTGDNYAAVAVSSDSTSGTLTEYIMAANNGNNQYDNPSLVRGEPIGGLYEVTMTFANGVPTYTPFNPTTPLPAGAVTDVVQDPSTPTTFYAAVIGTNAGIYRTIDDGKDWYQIASVSMMPELNNAVNVQLAPAKSLTMYVGIVGSNYQLDNVYYSTNDNNNLPTTQAIDEGVTWTAMGAPSTADGGINTYNLGAINFAIAADPNNSTQIYVGGDFAPPSSKTGTWPNTIGSAEDTGVVFRGNVSGKTSTWSPLVADYAQNTSPPGGTRELIVAPNGELMEASNGGLYDRTAPTGPSGSWISHNGLVPNPGSAQPSNGLDNNEFYSVAYNPLANTIIGGTQDFGVVEQSAQNSDLWNEVSVSNPNETSNPNSTFNVPISPVGISGGQIAIDLNTPGQALLYSSSDYFNNFFEQRLSSQMTTPPVPVTPAPTMTVNGAGGKTLYQVENNSGTSFAFQTPIAVNNVLANAIVVGSDYVYESTTTNATTLGGNGNNWTAIQGLTVSNGKATPINGVGPVTALDYGGMYNGQANPYILWVGSSGGDDLYLRAPSQASPTGQTFTTGTGTYQYPVGTLEPETAYSGGAPVGIVMNPTNWTLTYVASGSRVTLATVVPYAGSGTVTTSTVTFTSLGGPSGLAISDIVYVPLPTSISANDDEIVVSGWDSGNSNSTGVYKLLVNRTTGVADGSWTMVGVAADGVQTGVNGQKPQLPHVPVTSLTYSNLNGVDTLVVGTEGRGVWELKDFTTLSSTYAMTVTASGTVSFEAVANDLGYFTVTVNGVNDTIVAGPNTTLTSNVTAYPLPLSAIQDAIAVNLTGASNSLDINFVNGDPLPSIPNNPLPNFVYTGTGASNTLTVEDDTSSISLATTSTGSTLSIANSGTLIGLVGVTGTTLTGGPGNTNFEFSGWSVPASIIGGGGSDTLTYTSTNTNNIDFVLANSALTQTVVGGALLNATVTLNGISTANVTGGLGNSNVFDITNWTARGGSINGGTAGGVGNTLIDSTGIAGSYLNFNNAGISLSSVSGTYYRPLIGLGNLQIIDLSGISNNHFVDTGWSGTANIASGGGNISAVQVGSQTANTTFVLTNTKLTTSGGSVVNMSNIFYVQLYGGPGSNVYDVSNFHLTGYLTGGGTSNEVLANEQNSFTVSNNLMLVGANGAQGTLYLSGMNELNINTLAGANNVLINSFSGTGTLSAGAGQDTFVLGGTGNSSTLDGLGAFSVIGGNGSTLTLNDENGTGVSKYWYDMFNNTVVPDLDTPRAWGGVTYDGKVYNVVIHGVNAPNGTEFLVGPSYSNSFEIYGDSPDDFLGVLLYGTAAQNQTIINGANVADPSVKKTGYWTFSNPGSPPGQMAVSFEGLNRFNSVTPLVLAGGTGPGNTSSPLIRVYNGTTGIFQDQFYAYPSTFQGGVQVAVDQYNPANPNAYYIITAPGPGTPDLLKVWTTSGTLVTQFYAFGPNYTGGINVAVGDITGDGIPDIVVGAESNNTTVEVFDGSSLDTATPNLTPGRNFLAYPASYTGGVSVAAASFNGGKYDDIITVPYAGAPAQVKIFDGQSVLYNQTVTVVDSYYALPQSYNLGATVVVGNIDADGVPDIVVAGGADSNSQIVVTSGASAMTGSSNPTTIRSFYAYPTPGNATPTGATATEIPLRIGLKDILGDGRDEIFTAQTTGGESLGGMNVIMESYPGLLLAHLSISSATGGGLTIG